MVHGNDENEASRRSMHKALQWFGAALAIAFGVIAWFHPAHFIAQGGLFWALIWLVIVGCYLATFALSRAGGAFALLSLFIGDALALFESNFPSRELNGIIMGFTSLGAPGA